MGLSSVHVAPDAGHSLDIRLLGKKGQLRRDVLRCGTTLKIRRGLHNATHALGQNAAGGLQPGLAHGFWARADPGDQSPPYATDANSGDYGSSQVVDISNGTSDGVSRAQIDMVTASNWNAGDFDYGNVSTTTDVSVATHCRLISNMIPNHAFGVAVTGPGGGGWINAIDHGDTETTYIPVNPVRSNTAPGTPRNPPVFDFDGILLNGVGISMDSGPCYNPGVISSPLSLRSNEAGNTSGCGPRNSWFELPAYTIWHHGAENMAAVLDSYFAHGHVGTYHYHAMTHPLQEDADQTRAPSNGNGSPVIGFAPDGFPIYGHWFVDEAGQLVRAESGYETIAQNSRTQIPTALHGTPPTPWDIANNPDAFASDFGLEMGRYEEDWFYAGTGNLDECKGAFDINGDYGYYITDKYPFAPRVPLAFVIPRSAREHRRFASGEAMLPGERARYPSALVTSADQLISTESLMD